MKIKYSFVIPVYGCEQYLKACVESILSQKGDHAFEIILVDDGSRDRSGQIADMLARKDSRIRTFHKENGGAASARNFGLQQVTGDYVLFVDSDDTAEDQLLQHVDETLVEDPEALVIFGMAFDYYRDERLHNQQKLSCKFEGKYSRTVMLRDFQTFFDDNALSSACNKVFNIKIIRRYDLQFQESMNLYEDFDFVMNYLVFVSDAVFINKPYYHYRLHREDNHLHKLVKDISNLKQNMHALEKTAQKLQAQDCCCDVMAVYANLNVMLLSLHFYVNRYSQKQLKSAVNSYFECGSFLALYTEMKRCSEATVRLLDDIKNERYTKLWCQYRKRQIVSKIKEFIKRILRW